MKMSATLSGLAFDDAEQTIIHANVIMRLSIRASPPSAILRQAKCSAKSLLGQIERRWLGGSPDAAASSCQAMRSGLRASFL